jgi:multisubunit Na+/H+ antiporter MnhB subunit
VSSRRLPRVLAAGLATTIGGLLLVAVLALPDDQGGLGAAVAERIAESGASNPVTAVLLNFRGYDTWLEIGVLLLAVFGVLAVARTVEVTETEPHHDEAQLLPTAARLLAVLMFLVAGYVLWRGTFAAGGAFQAGAVLGAAIVLLRVAGTRTLERVRPDLLLPSLSVAFLAFLGVAGVTAAAGGPMLAYRDDVASVVIVALELAIAASTAVTLGLLFAAAGARR